MSKENIFLIKEFVKNILLNFMNWVTLLSFLLVALLSFKVSRGLVDFGEPSLSNAVRCLCLLLMNQENLYTWILKVTEWHLYQVL
jgi:hypothetical protein